MKKITLPLLCAILLFAGSAAYAGIVDVQFAESNLEADQFCVNVQVKAQDIDFELGSATVFFSYNSDAIANPTSSALNFNETNTCALGDAVAPYKNSFNFLQTNSKGEANYAILLNAPNLGCPTVTSEWIDVAEFCFEVVDAAAEMNLEFNGQYTAFNTVTNNGDQHTLGDLGGLESALTGIGEASSSSSSINVLPNYTESTVSISFDVPSASDVSITVYDMLGRTVHTSTKDSPSGLQSETLNLSQFGIGYYLVEVNNGSSTLTEKVLLTK